MRKLAVSLLLIIYIVSGIIAPAAAEESPFAGGDGTPSNPYLIETAEQLRAIQSGTKASYKLNADIDLQNKKWEPLGAFRGRLDGNYHTIRNFKLDNGDENLNGTGLFQVLSAGSDVEKLKFEGVEIAVTKCQGRDNSIGVLSGISSQARMRYLHLSNITIRANETDCRYVGHLIGAMYTGEVKNVSASNVTSQYSLMGIRSIVDVHNVYGANMENVLPNSRDQGSTVKVYNHKTYTAGDLTDDFVPNGKEAILKMFAPKNSGITEVTLNTGTFTGGWQADNETPEIDLPEEATSLVIKPTIPLGAIVKINGQLVQQAYTFTMIPSSFTMTIEQNGELKTYNVTVKQPLSSTSLASLVIEGATLSPSFDKDKLSYTATVSDPAATKVKVKLATESEEAKIVVNGGQEISNQPFTVSLDADGQANIKILVGVRNQPLKTYTVTVTRQAKPEPKPEPKPQDANATLTSLRLAQAGLSPAFNPNVKTYTAVVDYAVTNVDVLATPASATARVTVTKQPLREGANTVTVTVTAENGQVNVYTIQVIRLGFPIIVDPVVPVIPVIPTPTPQPQPGRVLEPTLQTKVPVSIVRKDEANAKVDEINVPLQQAMTIVNELKRTNQTNVTFPFQDDVTNKADKVRFILPTETLQQLNVADVTFQTPKATVQVPASVVQQYKTALNVTMDMTMPSSVAMPALPAGATIVTPPVDIQYRALGKVKVTLPVPANVDPATLRVLVQHSQGDNELVRGEVNYNANRLPESVSIWIDRFSIFSVVADSYANVTASVKGEAKEGTTLQTILSKDVPAAKYQWYRGTAAIAGATKSTYTATAEDANATLTVTITLPNGETIKQTTAVVKAKSCLEKATFGCVTPKSAATVYELVNGVAVATTKQVTNAKVAQAYLPAAYLLSPDGQWTEQVAGMKYTAISPALVAKANSGKLVSWQKQLVMKGQIGMVTTTKPQPLFTNGMQRVGYVQMKQNYRVFGTRQALYQIGVNEFVLASDVEFQGK